MYYIENQLSWRLFLSRKQDSFYSFFFSLKLKFKSRSQVKEPICLKQYFRSFLHTKWSCLEANKILSKTYTRFPRPRVRRRFLCINNLSDGFSLCDGINLVLTLWLQIQTGICFHHVTFKRDLSNIQNYFFFISFQFYSADGVKKCFSCLLKFDKQFSFTVLA